MQSGFIHPSFNPFVSHFLLVKKKHGSWHICVDYHIIDQNHYPDKYPIPNIDELLDELHGLIIFSKIDLCSSYHQIHINHSDITKAAFLTHFGHMSMFSCLLAD